MNEPTLTYREDIYSGDFIASAGWLMEVQLTLTQLEKLATRLKKETSLIRISQEEARKFQDKLLEYNDGKKTH